MKRKVEGAKVPVFDADASSWNEDVEQPPRVHHRSELQRRAHQREQVNALMVMLERLEITPSPDEMRAIDYLNVGRRRKRTKEERAREAEEWEREKEDRKRVGVARRLNTHWARMKS